KPYRQAFLAYQQQYMFVNHECGLAFDLHWEFVGKGIPFPIQSDEIWHTRLSFTLAGRKIPTLGHDELALFLVVHGLKGEWRSLGWILEFATIVARSANIDWMKIYRRAEGRQCGRAVLLALLLASILFGARVDERLLELAYADVRTQDRAAGILERVQY